VYQSNLETNQAVTHDVTLVFSFLTLRLPD